MKTKFTLLIAAGLLFTVATQAQKNSTDKMYATNYPAHNARTMTVGNHDNNMARHDKSFEKNHRKFHKEARHHHRHERRHHSRHHRH